MSLPIPRRPTSESNDRKIVAGTLGGPVGLTGEISCRPSRVGEDALRRGVTLWLDDGIELRVAATRHHHGRLVLRLDSVATPEDAANYAGRTVYIRSNDVVLADDEYLDDDLIGMRLVDASGCELGTVLDVRHYPAQDCLVVGPTGALVPLVREFIRKIDAPARRITVDVPRGLLDEALADEA